MTNTIYTRKNGKTFTIKACPVCGELEVVVEEEKYAVASCPNNHYARVAQRDVITN